MNILYCIYATDLLLTELHQTSVSDGKQIRCKNDKDCAMIKHLKCQRRFCRCTEGYRYIARLQGCKRGKGTGHPVFSFLPGGGLGMQIEIKYRLINTAILLKIIKRFKIDTVKIKILTHSYI